MNEQERIKICQLLIKKIEKALEPAEAEFLYEAMENNQEALDLYVDVALLYSSLSKRGKTSLSAERTPRLASDEFDQLLLALSREERDAEPVVVKGRSRDKDAAIHYIEPEAAARKISRFSIASLIVSAAAILFVAIFVRFAPVRSNNPIAILSRSVNAQWLHASDGLRDLSDLYAGPLHLSKGYAEIRTDNGTSIILQAPVEAELVSPSQLNLIQGRVTVTINQHETHYVVRTPTASVVDFGTEFGVHVDEAAQTLTHVYEGEIELRSGSNPLGMDSILKLTKGQGGKADAQGRLSEKNTLSAMFVRSEEFEVNYKASDGTAYERWLAHSYRLRRDPDIVLYYPFMETDMLQTFARNYALTTNEALNGKFGGTFGISNFTGPSWSVGRWPNKSALAFERNSRNCVSVPESAELSIADAITLAVWVRCPGDLKGGHLISNRLNETVNYQFGCFFKEEPYYPQRLQFLRTDGSAPAMVYSSNLYDWTSEWTFFAVTHDSQTVRFYVNGALFEAIPHVSDRDAVSAGLFIGDVPSFGGRTFGYAAFNGLIDEIAIFKRVLSPEEIQEMYESGKP